MAPGRLFTDKFAEILAELKRPNDQQNLCCWVGKWNITNSNSSSLRVGLTISIGVHLFTLQWYTSFAFICWCAPNQNQNVKLKFAQVLLFFLPGVVFCPPGKVRQNMLKNPSPVKHSWLQPARPLIVTRQCRRGPVTERSLAGWGNWDPGRA